jgi:hypothetical protein
MIIREAVRGVPFLEKKIKKTLNGYQGEAVRGVQSRTISRKLKILVIKVRHNKGVLHCT